MRRWIDTSIPPGGEDTFSEETVTDEDSFREETMTYETVIGSLGSGLDDDIDLEVSEYAAWKEEETLEPRLPGVGVFDVAAYILNKMGSMTTMKLQKLVYYSQAWSLVWDEKPLFPEDIEAWANGPVVKELFNYHRGMYELSSMPMGNPRLLDEKQRETIDVVLEYYGDKSAQWLIDLTHMEEPWIQTRRGLPIAERGNRVIPLDVIADYYSSLPLEEEGNA